MCHCWNFKNLHSLGGGNGSLKSKQKRNNGRELILIRKSALKYLITKKCFIQDKIIDHIPEKVVSKVSEVYGESISWIHPNLQQPDFWITFSFMISLHLHLYYKYMGLKESNLSKKRIFLTKQFAQKTIC